MRNIHPELVGRDVLMIPGGKDYSVPLRMLDKQARALINTGSGKESIFSGEEHGPDNARWGT
jgi:hypothetical protein